MIDITDFQIRGEYVDVSYFLNHEPEQMRSIELESLTEHIEYEGLNEGHQVNHKESGEHESEDVSEDATTWLEDRSNQKIALESYLKHLHRTKSFN